MEYEKDDRSDDDKFERAMSVDVEKIYEASIFDLDNAKNLWSTHSITHRERKEAQRSTADRKRCEVLVLMNIEEDYEVYFLDLNHAQNLQSTHTNEYTNAGQEITNGDTHKRARVRAQTHAHTHARTQNHMHTQKSTHTHGITSRSQYFVQELMGTTDWKKQ